MSDVIIDVEKFKKAFCDSHICEEDCCPFYTKCKPGANLVEKWLKTLSTEIQIYDEVRKDIRRKILDNADKYNADELRSLIEYVEDLIKQKSAEYQDIEGEEFVKATIYIVGANEYKIPYGTFDYLTDKQRQNVIITAKRVAKDFDCGYEIIPIKRKDL